MKKVHKVILVFFVFWGLVIAGLVIASVFQKPKMTFFYGDTCPHCKIVEKYFEDNGITAKYQITMKEVFNNTQNMVQLVEVSAKCGIAKDNVGVPVLYSRNKCYVGDADIIAFFDSMK